MRFVTGAAEGLTDQAVLYRLASFLGVNLNTVYGGQGKSQLLMRLSGFAKASRYSPWVVLIDLDSEDCPVSFQRTVLKHIPSKMCLRVVVREIEAWILADSERVSQWLRVPRLLVPRNPEAIANPKQSLIDLARRSRSRIIREAMVPSDGSGREVGPAYTSEFIRFVEDEDAGWRPDAAARNSDSLSRCLRCLRRISA
jgi:hypothetical protein